MDYTIEYEPESGVCIIQASGLFRRPEDSFELLRAAGTFAEEHRCSRFLFDMQEATVVGSTMDAYDTVIDPEKFGVRKFFRIAAVYSTITKIEKFMENVGTNRGAVAYRVFRDMDAARKWLS